MIAAMFPINNCNNAMAQTIDESTITKEEKQTHHNLEPEYVLNMKNMNKTVFCMAQNAYFEAGSESFKNMDLVIVLTDD